MNRVYNLLDNSMSFGDCGEFISDALLVSSAIEVLNKIKRNQPVMKSEIKILEDTRELISGLREANRYLSQTHTDFMLQPDEVELVTAIRQGGWEGIEDSVDLSSQLIEQIVNTNPTLDNTNKKTIEHVVRFLRTIFHGIMGQLPDFSPVSLNDNE